MLRRWREREERHTKCQHCRKIKMYHLCQHPQFHTCQGVILFISLLLLLFLSVCSLSPRILSLQDKYARTSRWNTSAARLGIFFLLSHNPRATHKGKPVHNCLARRWLRISFRRVTSELLNSPTKPTSILGLIGYEGKAGFKTVNFRTLRTSELSKNKKHTCSVAFGKNDKNTNEQRWLEQKSIRFSPIEDGKSP